MFNIDLTELQSGNLAFFLIGLFILNILLSLFLVHRYLEEKRRNRIMLQMQRTPDAIIAEYLGKQFNDTKKRNRMAADAADRLTREVIHLRTAYLKIEEKAIGKTINSAEYWQYINQNILKLIKILFPESMTKSEEVSELETKLQGLKQRIKRIPNANGDESVERHKTRAIASLDKITIDRHEDKTTIRKKLGDLEGVLDIFEDPETRQAYLIRNRRSRFLEKSGELTDQLDSINQDRMDIDKLRLAGNTEDFDRELAHFRTENSSLADQINDLKKELLGFQERMDMQTSLGDLLATKKEPGQPADLLGSADDLIDANEKEIDRLREIIAAQRRSIIEMEQRVTSLDDLSPPIGDEPVNPEIVNLRRSIQESETCITMLEYELEDMKSQIDDIRAASLSGNLSAAESEALSAVVDQLREEIEASRTQISIYEQFSNYTNEALKASSIEDMSLLIYETLTEMGFTPALLVKTLDRTLEVSPKGILSTRDKILINNLQIAEVSRGTQGRLMFRYVHVAGIIQARNTTENDEARQQLVIRMLQLSDRIIALLGFAQKSRTFNSQREATLNAVKNLYYDLDKLIKEQDDKSNIIINRNFQQILDIARVKGMTATQVAAIQGIEHETVNQIKASNTLRVKSRKNFLQLLKSLE